MDENFIKLGDIDLKEKLRIEGVLYDITSISTPSDNLLKIEFANDVEFGNINFTDVAIDLLTFGKEVCGSFEGYNTIYSTKNNVITLSNDGSVYVEPTVNVDTTENVTVELTEKQKAEAEKQNKISELQSKISAIDAEFKSLDYIGIKIATGRATIEEYSTEIAEMTRLADEKNALETELAELQGGTV